MHITLSQSHFYPWREAGNRRIQRKTRLAWESWLRLHSGWLRCDSDWLRYALGLALFPLDLTSFPFGSTFTTRVELIGLTFVELIYFTLFPLGLASFPLGLTSFPLGLTSFPLGLILFSLGLTSFSLGLTLTIFFQIYPYEVSGVQSFHGES